MYLANKKDALFSFLKINSLFTCSFQLEVQNLRCKKTMKNTAEVCPGAGGAKPPKSIVRNLKQYKKGGENLFPSMRLTIFVLHMYKQLTSEQRYTISVLLQKKMTLSFIAETIKVSVSTVPVR